MFFYSITKMPRTIRRRRAPRRKSTKKPLRRRVVRKVGATNETASCKELYSLRGMQSNTPLQDLEQNLGFYKRASAIGQNYQYFRIRYIKYKFIARYNTFQATTAEATAFPIPLLYHRIDKGGALPTTTSIGQLKAMGCKPIRFTKDITVAFKPGVTVVTSNNMDAAILPTKPVISPWLLTNKAVEQAAWAPNDTDHRGLYWYMETAAMPGDGSYEYDCEVEVMFDFKNPLGVESDALAPPARKASEYRQTTFWKPSPEQLAQNSS